MTSFRGAGWLGIKTSPRGKLTALACHQTKKVNKAEELTYLSTNIGTLDSSSHGLRVWLNL
jgi:hypothetical protein